MRERVTVVTLSVCHSVCHFSILEKAQWSALKLMHQFNHDHKMNIFTMLSRSRDSIKLTIENVIKV